MSITVYRDKTPRELYKVPFGFQITGQAAIDAALDVCGNGSGFDGVAFVRQSDDPYAFFAANPGDDFKANIRAMHAALKANGISCKPVVQTVPAPRLEVDPKDPELMYIEGFAADKSPLAVAWTRVSCYWKPLSMGFSIRFQKMELKKTGVEKVGPFTDFDSLAKLQKAVKDGNQPKMLVDRVQFALQNAIYWLRYHTFIRYYYKKEEEAKEKKAEKAEEQSKRQKDGVQIYAAYPVKGKPGSYQAVIVYGLWRKGVVPTFAVRDFALTPTGFSIAKSPLELGLALKAKKALEPAGVADLVDRLMKTWSETMAWTMSGKDAAAAQALMGNRGR